MPVPLEKFVQQLEDSGILAGETIRDLLPPNCQPKDAEELALELIRQKKLTKFQAERIYRGKGHVRNNQPLYSPAVFWKKYDAGEFGPPLATGDER